METHLKISPLQEENLPQGIGFLRASEDGYAVPPIALDLLAPLLLFPAEVSLCSPL